MATTSKQMESEQANPLTPELLNRFIGIVGPDAALIAGRDDQAMAPYLTEWRDRYRGRAALILRPHQVTQVAQILALANETRTAIVPQGGNTGLVGGQIPFAHGHEVIVSLTRLNRIREIDTSGNTLTVEAGVTLADAQQAAAQAGRLFPLSLASEGSCQIGGNLSTNAGGTAVLAYGNARDLTLGLEVVLPDGRIWHGLRGLRKDNTGYDLRDLFIGAEGTLGIITAATLKLFPQPRAQVTAFAGFPSLEAVAEFFTLAQASSGSQLTGFELLPRIGLEFALRHGTDVRDPLQDPHDWYVLFELSSPLESELLTNLMLSLIEQGIEAGAVADAVLASSEQQAQALWRIREMMSEVQKHEGGSIKHDISVRVADIPELITRGSKLVEDIIPGARPVPFGHFGDGNIHFNISQPPDMDREAFLAQWDRVSEAIHGLVAELNGSISAEHGIGQMKRQLLAAVKDPVELDLMRKIKATLDPNGIMNPGKLL